VRALGEEFNFSPNDLYRVELCIVELVTNIVSYSDPQYTDKQVELHAVIEAQRATFKLIDPAAAFDPFSRPPPPVAKTLEELQIGGRGITLVREFSNGHRYERRDNQNWVELIFELEQPVVFLPE